MTPLPTVIVLAAGKGERFKASGSTQDKLHTLLCGQRVRDHVLAAVQASGLPFHVVEREHTAHLHEPGMGGSIACGVAATAHASAWLVLPADLPLIQADTLLSVAAALQQHAVVVPFYQGQQGHPIGFDASCGAALLQLQGDQGARAVLAQHPVCRLDVVDEGCVLDVDTVAALAQAHIGLQKRLGI
ncbi:nucleotidyltransferase family protein [Limnohabitans sp.]|uniref:nucleotidyltransferase family protein n=1 Tax=Limnohabitans sp. TaxID=1907725 RepID=UPI00286F40FC|nr:nucleotidyltransferase family protein [Limnohabitans sp.]